MVWKLFLKNVRKLRIIPTQQTVISCGRFFALAGYYSKFIKDVSRISKPLSDMLPPTSPKKNKKFERKDWKWGNEQQQTFQMLKDLLTSSSVLAYPQFDREFELHTDASSQGLGAVLCQKQDDSTTRVIDYASHSLSKPERHH